MAGRGSCSSETMFRVPRDFDPSSDLLGYLRRHCPEKVKTTGPYFLEQIVQALHQVIQSRGLYDEGNPFIVLCDEEMEHVFGVTAFHVSEICTRVASHLTSAIETDHVLESNTELINISGLKFPSWGSETAKSRFARTIPIESQLFRVQPDFLKVLRLVQGVDQTRIIFDLNQVTNIFMKYVMENPQRIFDFRNVSVALVGGTPLGDALSIKAFARSQVRGIICSQLLPIPAEESMYLAPGTSRCKSEELLGSKTLFGRRKRNSRSKDVSVFDKSSEEETIYSAQGYETAAIGDTSASEISSSDDTFSQVYRDQYEVDDSSEDGGLSETNRPDSDEDSDVKDVAINSPLMQTSDFSNWADSDGTSGRSQVLSSSSTSESESSNDSSECIPPSKCVWCRGPIRRFLQYCQPCWDERKSWLAVRQNPRKRKRALVSKGASARRPRSISDEPERSHDEVVALGRSMSDPSPSIPLEEINEVEPTVVTASSGIGSFCSSQELSSFESGPSQDLILRLESQSEDEYPTEETTRKRKQEGNIYTVSKKIPKVDGTEENELTPNASSQISSSNPGPSEKLSVGSHSLNGQSPLCALCCSRLKDASFVHGRTSHQISCYPCAKKIFKNRETCPVCRRRIEKITKHFVF